LKEIAAALAVAFVHCNSNAARKILDGNEVLDSAICIALRGLP